MNTGVLELLSLGLVAIIAGLFWLIGVVREIAPADRGKWLLGIGFGSGVIAFSIKITLILTFSAMPEPILKALPTREYPRDRQADIQAYRMLPTRVGQTGYTWEALPSNAPAPADNPATPAKIALGKALFFDKRLSADGSVSCASCHEVSVAKGGSDGLSHAVGIHGQTGTRNAPTVLNAAFQRVLFWDGRAASLEEQAKGPLINPIEMGMASFEAVEQRVNRIADYQRAFSNVFDEQPAITIDNIAKAIAAYERTLITPESAYDRFVKGDTDAWSDSQLRGMALFESTGCVLCHSGPNFSSASIFGDQAAHRLFPALPNQKYETLYRFSEDLGVANDTPGSDRGIWRTPSLRNVSRTGPYFHNGSVDTLEEAVRIMASVQLNKTLSNDVSEDRQIHWSAIDRQLLASDNAALSDGEIEDIVAFLEALDGDLNHLMSEESPGS